MAEERISIEEAEVLMKEWETSKEHYIKTSEFIPPQQVVKLLEAREVLLIKDMEKYWDRYQGTIDAIFEVLEGNGFY